jgi:hypothetical protein
MQSIGVMENWSDEIHRLLETVAKFHYPNTPEFYYPL